jgi:transposase-like protein
MNSSDYSKREGRRYDADYKRNALALIKSGRTMIAVSRELGVCKSTLKYWRRQEARGGLTESKAMAAETAEQRELRRLRMEVADLQLQRKILKKALSIVQTWSQHDAKS